MADFFWNIADNIEAFFKTGTAAIIGAVFLTASVTAILLLIRHFEKRN